MTENLDDSFLTKVKFSQMIESVASKDDVSYIDAVIHICEKYNLEIEDIKKYISNIIKEKIEVEAMNLNYMPKPNTLPLD